MVCNSAILLKSEECQLNMADKIILSKAKCFKMTGCFYFLEQSKIEFFVAKTVSLIAMVRLNTYLILAPLTCWGLELLV